MSTIVTMVTTTIVTTTITQQEWDSTVFCWCFQSLNLPLVLLFQFAAANMDAMDAAMETHEA